jgi:hypothetical protein
MPQILFLWFYQVKTLYPVAVRLLKVWTFLVPFSLDEQVCLQTDNFCLILREQTDKQKNDEQTVKD